MAYRTVSFILAVQNRIGILRRMKDSDNLYSSVANFVVDEIFLEIDNGHYPQSIQDWISVLAADADIRHVCQSVERLSGSDQIPVADVATGILVEVLDMPLQITDCPWSEEYS